MILTNGGRRTGVFRVPEVQRRYGLGAIWYAFGGPRIGARSAGRTGGSDACTTAVGSFRGVIAPRFYAAIVVGLIRFTVEVSVARDNVGRCSGSGTASLCPPISVRFGVPVVIGFFDTPYQLSVERLLGTLRDSSWEQ